MENNQQTEQAMSGKTVLITGATSGIGYETAREIARRGADIVFTARNTSRGEQVRQQLISETGNPRIACMECHLDDLKSVRDFTSQFNQKHDRLHVLINNAGTWETKRSESNDGIELTFAVNHLAPFLLTKMLLEKIKSSSPARIINLASMAHKYGTMDFNDIEYKKSWGSMKSYSRSKLCNVLFTKHLHKILEGSGVTANCVHPGVVNTRLFDKMPGWMLKPASVFFISPAKGAETSVYLAVSSEVADISGGYFAKKKPAATSKLSQDPQSAQKLWELSEQYLSDLRLL
jgi:retinol dehydrogenase 12